jgi:hypothetical protein
VQIKLIDFKLFRGNSQTWRCHLTAGWKLLNQHRTLISQKESEDAWYVTQSFCLLKIEGETSFPLSEVGEPAILGSDDDHYMKSLTQNPIFGRTLGASSCTMECISEINRIYRLRSLSTGPVLTASTSLMLSRMWMDDASELSPEPKPDNNWQTSLLTDSSETRAMRLHLRAFKSATTIYYHRSLENLAPRKLVSYVFDVLDCLSKFVEICGGNYTLWPAFIASVEVFDEEVKHRFRALFATTSRMGMRNRTKVLDIVERVWEIRAQQATETGQQLGDTSVDWREVKRGLQMDVLII